MKKKADNDMDMNNENGVNAENKKQKNKKIIDIIVNIIVAVLLIFAIAISISAIVNKNKGYNEIFGKAAIAVRSDSMKGDKEDSFKKGDLIYVKILKEDKEKSTLNIGDVVTFWGKVEGEKALVTHRIIEIQNGSDGVLYITKGDNNDEGVEFVKFSSVIGIYEGSKLGGMGNVTMFLQGPTGFMIFVVVPTFIFLAYAGYNVYRNVKKSKSNKNEDRQISQEEREKIKAELLAEMQKEANEKETSSDNKNN